MGQALNRKPENYLHEPELNMESNQPVTEGIKKNIEIAETQLTLEKDRLSLTSMYRQVINGLTLENADTVQMGIEIPPPFLIVTRATYKRVKPLSRKGEK